MDSGSRDELEPEGQDDKPDVSASAAENGRDHTGTATAVQDGDYRKWLFIGCVNDHIFMQRLKPQGLRGEVGTAVPDVRKRDNGLDRFIDLFDGSVGVVEAIASDVFPDFVEICVRLRMKKRNRS